MSLATFYMNCLLWFKVALLVIPFLFDKHANSKWTNVFKLNIFVSIVTEEIVPGFQFSRASYLLSLLKPSIINDMELKVGNMNCLWIDERIISSVEWWLLMEYRDMDWSFIYAIRAHTLRCLPIIGKANRLVHSLYPVTSISIALKFRNSLNATPRWVVNLYSVFYPMISSFFCRTGVRKIRSLVVSIGGRNRSNH